MALDSSMFGYNVTVVFKVSWYPIHTACGITDVYRCFVKLLIPVIADTLLSFNLRTLTFPALPVNTYGSVWMFKISTSMIFRVFGCLWT